MLIPQNWVINHYFALDLLFLFIDRNPRVSSLRWYTAYKNLFSGFKVISSLTTLRRQNFCKKHDADFIVYLMQILLFISCSTCHCLGTAGQIFSGGIWLKSRDSCFSIFVKIMCVNYIIYQDNIIYSPLTPAWCS